MRKINRSTFESVFEHYKNKINFQSNDCWIWKGGDNGNGYGRISIGYFNTTRPVHRVFYELKHGEIPVGLEPHHICKNRRCCNPAHIELKTHKDNCISDLRKLTNANVQDAKILYESGKTLFYLSGLFQVDKSTLSKELKRIGVKITKGNCKRES